MRRPPDYSQFPRFPVTGGTILLAALVSLAYWGKVLDVTPLFADGNVRRWQLWRLVSSALPHGSPLHLLFNVYWTWVFGTLVEETFGHLRTFALFVLLALGSGAAEYAFLEGGIGLSGVGYGLFAFCWVLSRRDARFAGAVDSNTTSVFVIWFFVCIVLDWTGAMRIANLAHAFGALLGYLVGLAVTGPAIQRRMAIVSTAVIVLAVVGGSTVARPWVNLARDGGHGEVELGIDALKAGRNEEGVRWLRDATRMNPRDALAWYDLGVAYTRLKREDDAIAAFERAHQLEPANAEYLASFATHRAYGASVAGREEEAAEWYERVVAADPRNHQAWYALGYARYRLHQYSAAATAYRRALELVPTDARYATASEHASRLAAAATRRTTRPATTRAVDNSNAAFFRLLTGQ
jgi:membrane associated rhomboid family serine protease/Flp pilus assembly protein TadD